MLADDLQKLLTIICELKLSYAMDRQELGFALWEPQRHLGNRSVGSSRRISISCNGRGLATHPQMLVSRCQGPAHVVALSAGLAVHIFCADKTNRAADDRSGNAGNEPDGDDDRLRLGHAV